ncbi:MarR family winged helix-turn-helix transcriptional regulator [Nocardioides sp.]|uniref:MarR family winged helix-turn-helix transcriptional regulator n=1 Tax=Nocardioides sp. TaxID=35761 RepID=UPI0037846ADD
MSDGKDTLDSAARDLNSAAIHLLRGLRAVDRESGLTAARLSALSVLVFGGPCTLGRLARAEDVSSPTMTRIVDGLVGLGLAVREPHPGSAREVLVRATPDGTDLMTRAADRRVAAIAAALRALPTPERRAVVAASPALRALSSAVSESAGTARSAGP